MSMFQVAITFRVVVIKVECAIETLARLVNTPISGSHFQGFKFRRPGMGCEFSFLTSSQVLLQLAQSSHFENLGSSSVLP